MISLIMFTSCEKSMKPLVQTRRFIFQSMMVNVILVLNNELTNVKTSSTVILNDGDFHESKSREGLRRGQNTVYRYNDRISVQCRITPWCVSV